MKVCPVNIVITHPYCWPFVRRGTERHIDGLTRYLAKKRYDVVTVSTKPGARNVEHSPGGERILNSQLWNPLLGSFRIAPTHTFFFSCLKSLRSLDPDIVHSFFYIDAWAALLSQPKRKYRTILQLNGAPFPQAFYRFLPPERAILRRAIQGTDQLIVCSQFARQVTIDHFGVDPLVHVPPVDTDSFPYGDGPQDGRPTLLAVADFNVPRKGVRVLLKAFMLLKEKLPDAMLLLSGKMSDELHAELIGSLPGSIRSSVKFLGLGNVEDIPALYRGATLMVLPSMWEPSGSVMFEAWSSGTPVVATRHGGLPEFVNEGVGVLFDPQTGGQETMNFDGLAEAMLKGLELAHQPGVRMKCRKHAESYSWDSLGPDTEAVYRQLAEKR